MTPERIDEIVWKLIAGIDADRAMRGHRQLSVRGQDLLRLTTRNILENLELFWAGCTLDEEFRQGITREVQSYYRDEWYTVDTQIEYAQRLRDLVLEVVGYAGHAQLLKTLHYFDVLTLLVVEACRRPARYEWPLLVITGYGNLARNKLASPLKDLLPHTPFDLWLVDKRDDALTAASQDFAAFPQVRVLDASDAIKAFQNHPAATKLVYVATEASSHLGVVNGYTALGADVIAIEKPLCTTPGDIAAFRKLAKVRHSKTKHVVVDHYSFRRATLIVEGVKKEAPELFGRVLRDAEKMVFVMMERQKVDASRGAAHEGVILDMLPHVFPFISALVTTNVAALKVKPQTSDPYYQN